MHFQLQTKSIARYFRAANFQPKDDVTLACECEALIKLALMG
jgi:hypothetical protein